MVCNDIACRWPAVISPDPSDGGSRILDEDDEPLSYHVEFLGMKHSHAWVHTRFIELYGRLNDQQPLSSQKKGPKVCFHFSFAVNPLLPDDALRHHPVNSG